MHPVEARGDYFTRLLILLLAGILAHTLSGGAIVEISRFLILLGLIGLCLFLARNICLEGPRLAFMILILQSAGHLLLGGADKSNDAQMSAAHLFAGLLSYKTVTHFDCFWDFISELAQVFSVPCFKVFTFLFFNFVFNRVEPRASISHLFYTSLQFRGPPTREFA